MFILMTMRSEEKNKEKIQFQTHFLLQRIWEAYGTQVVINTDNIATRSGCEKLFKSALELGPIGGIFNLAVILRDSILENQTIEKFVECMLPKATATEYLGEFYFLKTLNINHFTNQSEC